MHELDFLESLFDKKLVSILRLFFQFSEKKFYLKEISENSKVSIASTHRILTKLVRLKILDEIKVSKFKIYQLAQNERTSFLGTFIKESVKAPEVFVDMVKDMSGVESIILVGKETSSKANLIIIGENIDIDQIKLVVSEIKDKYNFKITYISMAKEQYDQMSNMGLYPGTKKVLYQKSS